MVPCPTPAAFAIDCIVVSPSPARAPRAASSSRCRLRAASERGRGAADSPAFEADICPGSLLPETDDCSFHLTELGRKAMPGITGKAVAIAGASSGIGAATALHLARRGARGVL